MICVVSEGSAVTAAVVLILDPVRMHREALRALLQVEGYQVHEAADLASALDTLDRTCPQVVIVGLPPTGVSGREATRALSAAHSDLKVITVIKAASTETANAMLEAGAFAVVVLGDRPDRLLAVTRAAAGLEQIETRYRA